jgi:hypothetical protein
MSAHLDDRELPRMSGYEEYAILLHSLPKNENRNAAQEHKCEPRAESSV